MTLRRKSAKSAQKNEGGGDEMRPLWSVIGPCETAKSRDGRRLGGHVVVRSHGVGLSRGHSHGMSGGRVRVSRVLRPRDPGMFLPCCLAKDSTTSTHLHKTTALTASLSDYSQTVLFSSFQYSALFYSLTLSTLFRFKFSSRLRVER
jgi:hypothetical protein